MLRVTPKWNTMMHNVFHPYNLCLTLQILNEGIIQ